MDIFIAIGILYLFMIYLCVIRNLQVLRYRRKILRKVSIASRRRIWAQQPWEYLYDTIKSVGYYDMVFKFWKPLDSFWPTEFLQELDAPVKVVRIV